jgi:hypothetical protein
MVPVNQPCVAARTEREINYASVLIFVPMYPGKLPEAGALTAPAPSSLSPSCSISPRTSGEETCDAWLAGSQPALPWIDEIMPYLHKESRLRT